MPITLQSWLDQATLRPNGESVLRAVFEIGAEGSGVEADRQRVRTILALDVSHSMSGAPIAQVIQSVDRILDAVGPEDEIGIVAFSNAASRVVEPVRMDAAGKKLVRSRVHRLTVEGGTNIQAGLETSAAMLASAPSGMRRGVILLSDGAPNVGIHTAEGLRDVVRKYKPAISFFSLGYGADHSEDILNAVGDGYEYVADPSTCARAFARALGAQGDIVASDIELVLSPAANVEIIRLSGKERTRFGQEGAVIALPDMVANVRRIVVAELRVRGPGSDKFGTTLGGAKVRWLEAGTQARGVVEERLTIEIADKEPAAVAIAVRHVLLIRAEEAREEARALADRQHFAGAAGVLRRIMAEIEKIEGWVPNDGSPLAEAFELLVDEVMVYERRPDAEMYAMYRKSTVGGSLGTIARSAAKSRGTASTKMIEHIAGDMPVAWMINTQGAKHRLEEECVIGRTADADIVINSGSVSRRHAEIFANLGDFWVADMGSTNTTLVNGKALGRAPHKLTNGDVVKVGEVELRYVEAPRKVTD